MTTGAGTPEELETALEDAFVLGDRAVLGELFDDRAVLVQGGGPPLAPGAQPIDQTGGRMTQQTQALQPFATRSGEGEARWWFACLAVMKVTAEQTGGLLSIIEITEPPNAAGPLHVHHHEDEGFWILEGDVTIEVGDTTLHASAGDFAFGPRGIPHRYTVGPEGCRMLFVMTPGGLENMIRDMSVPAERRTLPPESDAEPDWAHVAAVAKAYGNELLG